LLYDVSGRNWNSLRRSVDFYDEGWLIWLEADTLIRRETQGKKSLDDFCRLFFGPPSTGPKLVTYTLEDIIAALNKILPYDWNSFFRSRVYEISEHAPLGGIENGGYKLVYNDMPNARMKSRESVNREIDLSFSLGIIVQVGSDDN